MTRLRLALTICLAATTGATNAVAQDFVTARGKLSDADFYRLVACAAPPGGDCRKQIVRWSRRDARNISVRVVQVDAGYPGRTEARIAATLDSTLAEINAAGARLRLTRAAPDETPDIAIHLLDLPENSAISGTGIDWVDGEVMETARFQLWSRDDGTIETCVIVYSRDLSPRDVQNLLLEELTQCLGLMTDIGGRYYESRSIFSETSAEVTRLGSQDILALRRHYP